MHFFFQGHSLWPDSSCGGREGRGEGREGRREGREGREERERGVRVKEEGGKRVVVIFLARKIMIDVFNSTDRPQFQTLLWVRQDLVQSKEVEPIDRME